jgi:CRP/FNR family transcriptional regulator
MLFTMLSNGYGEKTNDGIILNIKLTHQDLANMAGMTRETVTRIIDKLQKDGDIKVLKNKLILLNPDFLQTIKK